MDGRLQEDVGWYQVGAPSVYLFSIPEMRVSGQCGCGVLIPGIETMVPLPNFIPCQCSMVLVRQIIFARRTTWRDIPSVELGSTDQNPVATHITKIGIVGRAYQR